MSVSIPVGLRIILILASIFVLAYVVYSSVKEKMEVRYAILWITWAAVVLLFALFPDIAMHISNALGIISVTNFVFLLMTALLFMFNYYLFLRTSKMKRDIRDLNYELALLRKEVDDWKEKYENKKSGN